MTSPIAPPVRSAGATLATITGLAAATALLILAGRSLPFPADLHPTRLGAWADEVGGPAAAFTLLRALATALVGWSALGWVLGVIARRAGSKGAARVTDRLSLPVVRRLADTAAGLAVVGATLSPVAVAAAPAPAPSTSEPSVVMMTDLGPTPSPTGSTATSTTTTTDASPTTVAPRGPERSSSPATAPTPGTGPSTEEAISRPLSQVGGATWVIAPGDTLWHVAEATLAADLGRAPSGAEVVERLDRLVALNLDRLAVPGDPGLVFPGQEFVVS